MLHARTSRFKVETSWQGLVNRRIQKIEIDLKEITLVNRAGSLLAKGVFRREILYVEFDGRFRRVDDRVQFEVVVGKELPEPFPMLKTELNQDYYIFQPRQIGDNQAVLEQGFSLTVQEVEVERAPELLETIMVDCIVDRGSSSRLVQISLEFDERLIYYQDFRGVVQLNQVNAHLISGKIQGILEYFTTDHHLKTWVVEQSVGWLSEIPLAETDLQCIINGFISGSPALVNTCGSWQLELKIDYSWVLLEKRELPCVISPYTETNLPTLAHKIKTQVLWQNRELRLPKSYDLSMEGLTPTEVNIVVLDRNDRFGKKGLLLESFLKIEVYGRSPEGVEIYRPWEVGYSELIEGYDCCEKNGCLKLDAALQLQEIRFEATAGVLRVNLIVHYQLRIYQLNVINGIEDPKNGVLVLIPVLTELKKFSVMKEAIIRLRRKPLQINHIQASVTRLNPSIKQGWFQVTGDLDLTISYHHISGKTHEEIFTEPFSESFLWEENGSDWEVQLNPVIEFDTYHLEGMNVFYKYLIHFEVGFYRKSELKLKTMPQSGSQPGLTQELTERRQLPATGLIEELQLVLEKEIPLKFGNPKKIFQKKTYISRFDYRDALNAILAEGIFGTDLEYWDEDGFLRQERLDVPFWKFVPCQSTYLRELSRLKLFPEIVHASVVPVNAWPWQKGTVKISVELVLKRSKGDDHL